MRDLSKILKVAVVSAFALSIAPATADFSKAKYNACEIDCYMDNGKKVCPTLPDCQDHVDP